MKSILLGFLCFMSLLAGNLRAQYGTPPQAGLDALELAKAYLSMHGIDPPPELNDPPYGIQYKFRGSWRNYAFCRKPGAPTPTNPDKDPEIILAYTSIENDFPGGATDPLLLALMLYHEYQHASGAYPTEDPCCDINLMPVFLPELCQFVYWCTIEFPTYSTDNMCKLLALLIDDFNTNGGPMHRALNCPGTFSPIPPCQWCAVELRPGLFLRPEDLVVRLSCKDLA